MNLETTVKNMVASWRLGQWQRPLLSPRSRLILAVSGGPDSLALLHLFSEQELHPRQNLIVAHLNHQLRPDAAADAAFVRDMAAAWGVGYRETAVDVATLAETEGRTIEEAGRLARYRYLTQLCRQERAHFVLTGHQADDQVETILHHLLRGTGPAGLAAMAPVARLPEAPGWPAWLLRPLLTSRAADIRAYCAAHNLQPRQDSSNQETHYRRNQIRLELIPQLEQFNPQLRERLLTLARLTRADEQYLSAQTEVAWQRVWQTEGPGWLRLARAAWLAEPIALRRRLLRRAAAALLTGAEEMGFRTIDQACQVAATGRTGAQARLPGGVTLENERETLLLYRPEARPTQSVPQAVAMAELPVPGQILLADGWSLSAEIVANPGVEQIRLSADPMTAFVRLPAGPLHVRGPLAADRFLLPGGGSQPLRKYLAARGVAAATRAQWPLVVSAGVVWVPGFEVSRDWLVPATVTLVLRLQCRREVR
jgi:tRNA(Ile)-lysidine synthase